jgi:hypothetical protein
VAVWESVTELSHGLGLLRRRRYGMVETADERLVRIVLRPFPKLVSLPHMWLDQRWRHRRHRGNRCRLYYNQPRRFPNYLILKYVVADAGTSLATFRLAVLLLDEIARIKQSDALLCDVANLRISDRLLRRWGWEPLRSRWLHRYYIKRFYGQYPSRSEAVARLVSSESTTPWAAPMPVARM